MSTLMEDDIKRWADGVAGSGTPTALLLPLQGHLGTSLGAVDAHGRLAETIGHDAFGQRTDASAAVQSHRFAGEYWDQDSQLLYLRARWYDPRIGGFISGDPFEGKQSDPRSLNRYAYASANPVHNSDPTGEMTLGEVGSTLNTLSTLATTAVDVINMVRGDPDSDQIDGPPGLWDYLMAFTIRGLAASVGGGGGQNSDFRDFMGPVKGPPHHTIPVYTCGHINQRMSTLLKKDHDLLHDELYRFTFGINFAGITIDWLVYKKPTSRLIKTPLQRTGQKHVGRAAIAAGLAWYYARDGWLTKKPDRRSDTAWHSKRLGSLETTTRLRHVNAGDDR